MGNIFDGVNVNKLNGNLGNIAPSDENEAILIYVVPNGDLPAGVAYNTSCELLQPQDAIDLGFTAAHDANNNFYCLGTIQEFFDYNPNGVLHLIPVASGDTISEILALASVKAAIRTASKAKGIAIANSAETAVDLENEVEPVQAVIAAFAAEHRLIDFILLQGNNGTGGDVWAYGDLPDLRAKNAPNVCISIGQDPYVAVQDAAYRKQADIGTVLGNIMVRNVSENLGSVQIVSPPDAYKANPNYTLTRGNRWKAAQLANGIKMETLSPTVQTAISNKGYIFAGKYEGYDGLFFNDSPTCVAATSDYSSVENNRTWNKAARLIRLALLPKVKGKVKKDPATGFIKSTTIGNWVGLCNKALNTMVTADEISGFSVNIPSNQIPNASTPVVVKASIVKDGIVFEFSVDLGLVNNI
ncbi:MAG: DUF2586 family protein [Candidatus Methylacidiphilales bacterium]